MNSFLPKVLDLNGMSLTTSLVVWSMIAFLAALLLLLAFLLFKSFYPRISNKKSTSKKVEPKGFGGFSN